MKKNNNKYRSNNNNNNYNNQIYSLNYRFDSISCAGKISGTALDLIKRYNELAKEAQGNADYVEAENFRQYAEHYRKIVTEINERKNQNRPQPARETENQAVSDVAPETTSTVAPDNNAVPAAVETVEPTAPRREFKVIEIKETEPSAETEPVAKPQRGRGRRPLKAAETAAL